MSKWGFNECLLLGMGIGNETKRIFSVNGQNFVNETKDFFSEFVKETIFFDQL